jgi:hypothetical protein
VAVIFGQTPGLKHGFLGLFRKFIDIHDIPPVTGNVFLERVS